MAAAAVVVGKAEEEGLLQCAICLENMTSRSPRALHCLHTFCHGCLLDLAKGKRAISCPTCRGKTKLPKNGVNGLHLNFIITSLSKPKVDRVTSRRCEECDFVGKYTVPALHCSRCDLDLCDSCSAQHMKDFSEKPHSMIKVARGESDGNEICAVHGKEWQLYCLKCHKPLCEVCANVHMCHKADIQPIKVGIQMESKGTSIKYNDLCRKFTETRDQYKEKFKAYSLVQQEIDRWGETLKQAIDAEVRILKDSMLKPVTLRATQMEDHRKILQEKVENCLCLDSENIAFHYSLLKNYQRNLVKHEAFLTEHLPGVGSYSFIPRSGLLFKHGDKTSVYIGTVSKVSPGIIYNIRLCCLLSVCLFFIGFQRDWTLFGYLTNVMFCTEASDCQWINIVNAAYDTCLKIANFMRRLKEKHLTYKRVILQKSAESLL